MLKIFSFLISNHEKNLRFQINISKIGKGNKSKHGIRELLSLFLMAKTLSPTLTLPPWLSIPRFMPKNGEFWYSSFSLGSKDVLKLVLWKIKWFRLYYTKGQLISKPIYDLLTSPKKRTDEFDLFAVKSKKANKSNSSVRFFGEVSRS